MKKPGVLFVLNAFQPGGAEMFAIRLAKYLQQDYRIVFFSCGVADNDKDFIVQIRKEIDVELIEQPLTEISASKDWLFWKLNALASLWGVHGTFVKLKKWEIRSQYKRLLRKHNIRAVTSAESHSDSFSIRFFKHHFKLPVIITMHSAYNEENWGDEKNHETVFRNADYVLGNADAIIYTADANTKIFNHISHAIKAKAEKVYLGFTPKATRSVRHELSIGTDDFVICMMARGIPEKGWQQLLNAFILLQEKHANSHLLLIHTDTGYMSQLKSDHSANEHIHFLGYLENPENILASSDCSVLPSHFPESLPYAITESLACGTPVFATPVAEIPNMLATEDGYAGGIIQFKKNNVADSEMLAEQLAELATSLKLQNELNGRAENAFKKFSMDVCGSHYKNVFNLLVDAKNA